MKILDCSTHFDTNFKLKVFTWRTMGINLTVYATVSVVFKEKDDPVSSPN